MSTGRGTSEGEKNTRKGGSVRSVSENREARGVQGSRVTTRCQVPQMDSRGKHWEMISVTDDANHCPGQLREMVRVAEPGLTLSS